MKEEPIWKLCWNSKIHLWNRISKIQHLDKKGRRLVYDNDMNVKNNMIIYDSNKKMLHPVLSVRGDLMDFLHRNDLSFINCKNK